jgi:hypothetical protein
MTSQKSAVTRKPKFFVSVAQRRNWKLRPWLYNTFTPKNKKGEVVRGYKTVMICGVLFARRVPESWDGSGLSAGDPGYKA